VKLRANVATRDFERLQPVDEQMDEYERIRLLYVGCTRARDHLVVSCHRLIEPKPTAAELLWSAGGDSPAAVSAAPGEAPVPADRPSLTQSALRPRVHAAVPVASGGIDDAERTRADFEDERGEMLRRSAAPASLSATGVAGRLGATDPSPDEQPGWFKDPVDVDLPPWQRGRDGAALGRAVHATLQDVDLISGADLTDLAHHHAAAEGIAHDHDQVRDLARAALSAPSVREARSGDHWREIYVAAPAGHHLVEGYVDLLYRTADGFVVVDYKTDAASTDAQRRQRAASYRLQLATYAHAIEAATGIPVLRGVLCFLDAGGAHEVEVEDLRAAVAEIGRLVDPA
jgi:ATP-dependent helicase/nuclease subunit A